jgi:nitroreductase
MLDQIKKRRSIRKYTAETVPDADIRSLLEAAMAAPSANDARPWEVVVVQRNDLRTTLAAVHPWAHMCGDAPVVFVVLGDQGHSTHWVEDCSALTENLLLAVTGLGLGAVWVAVYPDVQGEASVRSALGIPQRLRVLCLVPVGHPAESKPAGSKFDERKVHFDGYGSGSS